MAGPQRICVLSKLVHASERQWCRLVIPNAVHKMWTAMQKELGCAGNDFQLYVTNQAGSHVWCFGVRMMVQRPMLLELAAFYRDCDVKEGDTVHLYRDITNNQLIADIQRGAGHTAAAPKATTSGSTTTSTVSAGGSGNGGSAAALSRAASSASDYAAAAAVALAACRLPGQVWTAHQGKATKPPKAPKPTAAAAATIGDAAGSSGSGGGSRRRSPAYSEEEDDEDADWSPTHRGGRGGRGSGPLPLRRKVQMDHLELPPKAYLSAALAATDSDEDCNIVYTEIEFTAEELRRFDALVDAAARMTAPANV